MVLQERHNAVRIIIPITLDILSLEGKIEILPWIINLKIKIFDSPVFKSYYGIIRGIRRNVKFSLSFFGV
ncbi:MAG: hypothetical protein A2V73_03030 [candidate division Zixibacteria bacterium RBG_19FT_COMBO_42_43]|nr:MAG: hypothetical protein A2V73_03030 [candidate division Zixibacteria bacterium RBG_19FT_COMBO_42_43]